MFQFWSLRWSALTVALGLMASAARAEMITPDSIPNPPPTVGSANGTSISASDNVVTQYGGLGLHLNGAAITKLDGVSVWAPVGVDANAQNGSGIINYASPVGGGFVSPNSSNPTTVTSLSVDTFGLTRTPTLQVFGLNGKSLNIVPVLQSSAGPLGPQVWNFTGAGINSFLVTPPASQTAAWGVSAVSFTPTTPTVPEPSSLLLAGLGALGVATRLGWRRVRAAA